MSKRPVPSILFVTRRFPPSVGGMERFAHDLSKTIGQNAQLHLIKWGGKNKYVPLLLMPLFFVRASWILLTNKVDIIHMQDGVLSVLGVSLKYIFHKPLVVVIHGLDITHKTKLYQYIIPGALKRADHIFCISKTAEAEVIRRGIPKEKVSFVPLGVADDQNLIDKASARQQVLDEFSIKEGSKIILSVGRLVKRKGIGWFIDNIMPELIKISDDVVLVVSGDGPEKAAIQKVVEQRGLNNRVFLTGRTSDKTLRNLYNGSDVFVMPNISVEGDMEGFGRVLLEAALCELPVVASAIEGITDAIADDRNGCLVAERDSSAFIDQLKQFLGSSYEAKKFGKKARQFTLENYSWEKIVHQYLNEYGELLN